MDREVQFKKISGLLFLDRVLAKSKEESGNILFRMPKGVTAADATALMIWIVDPAHAVQPTATPPAKTPSTPDTATPKDKAPGKEGSQ